LFLIIFQKVINGTKKSVRAVIFPKIPKMKCALNIFAAFKEIGLVPME